MKLYEKNLWELSQMLEKKQCSSKELTADINSRIKAVEGKVRAFINLNNDDTDTNLNRKSPLAGIPIAVKDNISTKGILTTCGSKMLENYVPPYNATAVEKILNAGMIISGKTNMDEFAMGSSTETSYFHKTFNPHDLSRVPGGSSGGSAASIASGEAVIALGSDTGGSVRQPASMCGVVGFKPSYGRISRYGLVAFASSFDQIGILSKSVKDSALLLSCLAGADKMDTTTANLPYQDFYADLNSRVGSMRIGVPREYFGSFVDDSVKKSIFSALKEYEKNGAQLREISLPMTKYAVSAYYIISSAEASSNLARFDGVRFGYRTKNPSNLEELYEKSRSEGFGDEVKRRIMAGTFVLSSGFYEKYYKKAKIIQHKIREEISQAFDSCNVIALPTAPETAFKIGERIGNTIKMYESDICTVTANLAGLPAISIPCGRNSEGLPIGLQLMGKRFDDQTVLDCAYGYEEICGGFQCLSTLI